MIDLLFSDNYLRSGNWSRNRNRSLNRLLVGLTSFFLQVVGLANEELAAFKKAGRLLSGQEADELFSEPPAAKRNSPMAELERNLKRPKPKQTPIIFVSIRI